MHGTEVKLDLQQIEEIAGGDNVFVKNILQAYLEEITVFINKMKTPLGDEDLKSFKDLAHQVKPSVGLIGLHEIKEQMDVYERYEITVQNTMELISQILPALESSVRVINNMQDQSA